MVHPRLLITTDTYLEKSAEQIERKISDLQMMEDRAAEQGNEHYRFGYSCTKSGMREAADIIRSIRAELRHQQTNP